MIESPPQIRASAADLEALVDRTAEALGIEAAFVEKDFWVIEALRVATSTTASHGVRAIFKGGTSLSRAFGIIQRFSEDVDLLLDFPEEMSKGARDRAIKAIGEDVRLHFGIAKEKVEEDSAGTGVKRNFRLHYPNAKSADAITEGICLEIGSRGGPTPSRDVPIRSMVAEHAMTNLNVAESEYEEFASHFPRPRTRTNTYRKDRPARRRWRQVRRRRFGRARQARAACIRHRAFACKHRRHPSSDRYGVDWYR